MAVGPLRATLIDTLGGRARDAVIVGEGAGQLGALPVPGGAPLRVPQALLVLTEPPSLEQGKVTDKGSVTPRAVNGGPGRIRAG